MRILPFLIICSFGFSGCSMIENFLKYKPSARNVKKSKEGGIIALKTEHREEDQKLAKTMMENTCKPRKAIIAEEGEVVIGTITNQLATKKLQIKQQKKAYLV